MPHKTHLDLTPEEQKDRLSGVCRSHLTRKAGSEGAPEDRRLEPLRGETQFSATPSAEGTGACTLGIDWGTLGAHPTAYTGKRHEFSHLNNRKKGKWVKVQRN